MTSTAPHEPVLLDAVINALAVHPDGQYIDATFGAGGYSRAILNKLGKGGSLIAFDRDPAAHQPANDIAAAVPEGARFQFIHDNFSQLQQYIPANSANGIAFDLGVSSMQLDQAARGFSFMQDGPLDMRMAQSGLSAENIVNDYSQEDLANIIYRYGEERKSRVIAAAIIRQRTNERLTHTRQLVDVITKVIPPRFGTIHPATRTFQALRIAVNDELQALETALHAACQILKNGGIIAVVSFHSLEDRIVKQFFVQQGISINPSRHLPMIAANQPAQLAIITRKPITPGDEEQRRNPRSRSAKLRVAQKLPLNKE